MKIFSTSAGNKTQPISQTYIPASEQLNMGLFPLHLYRFTPADILHRMRPRLCQYLSNSTRLFGIAATPKQCPDRYGSCGRGFVALLVNIFTATRYDIYAAAFRGISVSTRSFLWKVTVEGVFVLVYGHQDQV